MKGGDNLNTVNHQIVTNNPLVKEKHQNLIFIDGSYEDVLLKVRDLVHKGSELVNHPLGASIRMFFSPYRSIIIKENESEDKEFFINTIETSIESYKNQMGDRKPDIVNSKDYSIIDEELLTSALEEFERLYN